MLNNIQEIKDDALNAIDEEPVEGEEILPRDPIDPDIINKNIKVMLSQLTIALEKCGIVNPYNKVYYLTKPAESMPLFMHLFTMAALSDLKYDMKLCTLRKFVDPKNPPKVAPSFYLDGPHLIVGILTMFKQFHHSSYRLYFQHMAHFHKCIIKSLNG